MVSFKEVKDLNLRSRNRSLELVGTEFETNTSGRCVIVDYKNAKHIVVMFYEPLCYVECTYQDLKNGEVKNKLYPSFYNKGFIGVGKYSFKDRKVFKIWNAMLKRAYCKKHLKTHASYEGVTVCDEWLNFQNFAEWCYSEKFYDAVDNEDNTYNLDKDILVKGNKVYSPYRCCFVPQDINKIIVSRRKLRGKYPVGVSYLKDNRKFSAAMNKHAKSIYLGSFDTAEEAFAVYKVNKESHIKDMAEIWKDRIDERVYQALLNYEVHIDD